MTARRSSLLQLVLVAAGAAACGGSTSDSGGASGASGGGAAGASGTAGSAGSVGGGSGGGGSGGGIAVAMLPALPDGQAGLCTSEGTPGLTGPCCKRLTCFNAPSGKCPIPSIDSQMGIYQSSGCTGSGSGTCNCGFIEGPYAKGATEASCGAVDGACCYLVPIQSCTGRPLLVDMRGARVAQLARRADWAG